MASRAHSQSFVNRHYLLLRRLHSLTGVFPVGFFLFPHLTTNSAIVWGRLFGPGKHGDPGVEAFQHEVGFIHSLPALILIEIFFLWLPLLYHSLLGIWFATTGKHNVNRYGYQDNWRYSLQRWTGYIGVVFIFLHVSSLRWGWDYGGLLPVFEYDAASSTTGVHFQGPLGWAVGAFYLIGVLSLVFHFANGLWTAAITWGLTVSEHAMKRWGYVCAGVGVSLSVLAVAAVVGFSTLDIAEAKRVEAALRGDPQSGPIEAATPIGDDQ